MLWLVEEKRILFTSLASGRRNIIYQDKILRKRLRSLLKDVLYFNNASPLCLLDWAVDHRAGLRAQLLPAAGGGSFAAGSPEQGAETEAAGAWGNHQVQVQILHHHPGGQDRSAGRTAWHRVKVSASAMDTLVYRLTTFVTSQKQKVWWMLYLRKPELIFCESH